jgi:hypothetical protein
MRTELEGHMARMGEKRNSYKVFGRKIRRKGTTWEDNIKVVLKKLHSCALEMGPLAGVCEDGSEYSGSIKCWRYKYSYID